MTVFVRGRVQGVGCWWTRARARELGVTGHARNTPDGRVEIVAEGTDEVLRRFRPCSRRTPPRRGARGGSCRCRRRSGPSRGAAADSRSADAGAARDGGRGRHPGVDGGRAGRLGFLRWRRERHPPDLARLRSSIDNIDAALVHLLAERFKATQRVGELKAAAGLPPADPSARSAVARLRGLADEAGLDPQFAEKFITFVIAEVIRHHEAIASAPGRPGPRAGSLTDGACRVTSAHLAPPVTGTSGHGSPRPVPARR